MFFFRFKWHMDRSFCYFEFRRIFLPWDEFQVTLFFFPTSSTNEIIIIKRKWNSTGTAIFTVLFSLILLAGIMLYRHEQGERKRYNQTSWFSLAPPFNKINSPLPKSQKWFSCSKVGVGLGWVGGKWGGKIKVKKRNKHDIYIIQRHGSLHI